MHKSQGSIATDTQVIQRAKELKADVLDYESALWLFCPLGKAFDFGDMRLHYVQYEYGPQRSEFMHEALLKVHPQARPEFFPCLEAEAYRDAVELLEGELVPCEEPQCAFCRLRQHLPSTPGGLQKLARFCLEEAYQG